MPAKNNDGLCLRISRLVIKVCGQLGNGDLLCVPALSCHQADMRGDRTPAFIKAHAEIWGALVELARAMWEAGYPRQTCDGTPGADAGQG